MNDMNDGPARDSNLQPLVYQANALPKELQSCHMEAELHRDRNVIRSLEQEDSPRNMVIHEKPNIKWTDIAGLKKAMALLKEA